MRAPKARAISQVRSVEPESTRIVSSATPWSEASARGKSNSSLYAIRIAVSAGIGIPKQYGSTRRGRALRGVRRKWADALRLARDGKFRSHTQQDSGPADAEFGKMFQLRHADAFVFKKCAVRGFQIAQPDDVVFDLESAMPARDFLIVDDDVRVRSSHHDTRLLHGIDQTFGGARNDGKADGFSFRKAQADIFNVAAAREPRRAGATRQLRQRREHLGRIRILRDFD